MSQQNAPQPPATELSLVEALNRVTSADPGPQPDSEPDTASAKTAFRRCCAAWQRAYKAYMDEKDHDPNDKTDVFLATQAAAPAYCHAMPMLAGPEGIRDFIACAAHGMLVGAISAEKGSQLLYAAQVAIHSSNPGTRMLKPPPRRKTPSR